MSIAKSFEQNRQKRLVAAGLTAVLAILTLATAARGNDAAKAELPVIFEERFETIPLDRFKNTRGGELEWRMNEHLTIKEGVSLVRPVQAGPDAAIDMRLDFLPLANEANRSETRVGFVLANRTIASAALIHERKDEKQRSQIQFILETDPAGKRVVRDVALPAELAGGSFRFRFRYGLLEVIKDDMNLATGCFDSHHIPIMGVTWTQESGGSKCQSFVLSGSAFPKANPRQDELSEASRWNEKGGALYREKKFAEALEATKKGLEIYKAVLGDAHHDTANSLANVATILQGNGESQAAVEYFDQAIKIRESLMGPDHPDTAILNMQAGAELVRMGKLAEAHPYCLKAMFSFLEAYGDQHPATETLRQMLDKLPRPE